VLWHVFGYIFMYCIVILLLKYIIHYSIGVQSSLYNHHGLQFEDIYLLNSKVLSFKIVTNHKCFLLNYLTWSKSKCHGHRSKLNFKSKKILSSHAHRLTSSQAHRLLGSRSITHMLASLCL
jgi:hypothetical protein